MSCLMIMFINQYIILSYNQRGLIIFLPGIILTGLSEPCAVSYSNNCIEPKNSTTKNPPLFSLFNHGVTKKNPGIYQMGLTDP